jgi:hypothetical protein
MITLSALLSMKAASSALPLLTGRCSCAPAGRRARLAAEAAQDHVEERAVHRLAHDVAQDRARRAHQRAGDDQHAVVQREADARRRPAGVAVEHRHHHRHVGAADRDDQRDADDEGQQASIRAKASIWLGQCQKPISTTPPAQRQVQHVLAA